MLLVKYCIICSFCKMHGGEYKRVNFDAEKKRLGQEENLKDLFKNVKNSEMLTVYCSKGNYSSLQYDILCALIPPEEIEVSLSNPCWDFHNINAYPQTENFDDEIIWERYSDNRGLEPLVIIRDFDGIRPDYLEINQEFILFHKLYHDVKSNRFIKIDEAGHEDVVAIISKHEVKIRLKEIRQFLAVKQMFLSIQFDYKEFSNRSLEELKIPDDNAQEERNKSGCYSLFCGGDALTSYNAFSRLYGKRLIFPPTKETVLNEKTKNAQRSVEFIIGENKNGEEIFADSNLEVSANTTRKRQYLTRVCFRKEVLDKYYQEPRKYTVDDSTLSCGKLWYMKIDNHHSDVVYAWLGDIGSDLPYTEQLHWKSFNVPPSGSMSSTFINRQLLCEFTDSKRPEHQFMSLYFKFQETCNNILGWQILLTLNTEDYHHLKVIRVPSSEEQKQFDELILSLTKVIIDSLNEKGLNKLLSKDQKKDLVGSISRLEKVMQAFSFEGYEKHIHFLRILQSLRSSGAAHRKGSKYQKLIDDLEIEGMPLNDAFETILSKANDFLSYMTTAVLNKNLSK